MSVAGLFSRAEAIQGSVHAGGTHEEAHGRKATQMHCESTAPNQISGPMDLFPFPFCANVILAGFAAS